VVDPASPYQEERDRLYTALRARRAAGDRVERLFLTHHHYDHVAGTVDLRDRLAADGEPVTVAAHPITAALLEGPIEVTETIDDGAEIDVGGRPFLAVFTPGHAPGHLALHDAFTGSIVAGDMVAGIGTIVLDPSEADLEQYLASLERLRALRAQRLLPAHGPVLVHPDMVLSFYVAHRHQRSDQIRAALQVAGEASPAELAPRIYPELDPSVLHFAAAQITTHLRWLAQHGLATPTTGGRWAG
jgi:glyoxylase-like metal-dependent hydrolase (beta-lactamase superfamily II)